MLVKIESQHPVRARRHYHVGEQLRSYCNAWLIFTILPRITVVRHHAGDACRRRAACSVDKQQQLHDVVGRRIRRLNDEHIVAANVIVDPNENLTIRESRDSELCRFDVQVRCNFFGEAFVPSSADQLEPVTRYGKTVHCLQPRKLVAPARHFNCPRWIRTTITGSKDRCPAIGRGGRSAKASRYEQAEQLCRPCASDSWSSPRMRRGQWVPAAGRRSR